MPWTNKKIKKKERKGKEKKEKSKTRGSLSHFYCVPSYPKHHFLSFQGDKETYIMWAEDAVFWSITQATEVNGFKPSLAESCHKFSKVGAGDLEADGCCLRGGQTLGITVPLKGTEHQSHKTYSSLCRVPGMGRILPTHVLLCSRDK